MSIGLSSKYKAMLLAASGAAVLGSTLAWEVPTTDAVSAAASPPRVARVARSLSLSEAVVMRPVGKPGHILNERGTITGTYRGSIETQQIEISTSTREGTLTAYTSGGSLKAKTVTHARPEKEEKAVATFRGSATITGGTGTWAHASGTLTFNGTLDRQNLHTTAELHGSVHA